MTSFLKGFLCAKEPGHNLIHHTWSNCPECGGKKSETLVTREEDEYDEFDNPAFDSSDWSTFSDNKK